MHYPAYEDGHLLVAGGLSDQPARYVAVIQELRRLDRHTVAKHDEIKATEGAD